jgi:flavin reductase (DIM6/NTAB) family NADH-FMN oxidoreductase RutF
MPEFMNRPEPGANRVAVDAAGHADDGGMGLWTDAPDVQIGDADVARSLDAFAHFGLDALPAREVGAPLVGQCHSCFECRLYDDSQVETSNLFIWEIVRAHVAQRPKLPRTVHYRGDGRFMVAGAEVSRRRRFKPDML